MGRKLTEEEKAQIEFDSALNQMIANELISTGEQMANLANQSYGGGVQSGLGLAAQSFGLGMAVVGAFSSATAEEDKKRETFLNCMEELDWKMKDSEENE